MHGSRAACFGRPQIDDTPRGLELSASGAWAISIGSSPWAERHGLDFNLAFIPASFDDPPDEVFDAEWMRQLFDPGYEMGKNGYPWHKAPPR